MKKLILGFIILIIISLVAVYVFIPGQLTISDYERIQCSISGANRILSQPANWEKLWQNDKRLHGASASKPGSALIFDNDTFRITRVLQNGLQIDVAGKEIKAISVFSLLPLTQDSLIVNWSFQTTSPANPINRYQQYKDAVHLKKSMESVLKNIKNYLSRNEMVYGFPVNETSITDTFLISTKKEFTTPPTIQNIYAMIDELTAFAEADSATLRNAPMLNITSTDNNRFVVMTAIPVNKPLTGNSDITYKRMVPGRFLTTTISGDNKKVENVKKEMQLYFQDYGRIAMAIPFMYLVTDRRKQPDSTKWVTKLYFPVM